MSIKAMMLSYTAFPDIVCCHGNTTTTDHPLKWLGDLCSSSPSHLGGRGTYILFWNLLMKAPSSSHGQLVAHRRNMRPPPPPPQSAEVSAPSICLRSSVLMRRVCSSSLEERCLHTQSTSSMKTTFTGWGIGVREMGGEKGGVRGGDGRGEGWCVREMGGEDGVRWR